jgi:hypothetical protein
MSVAWPANLTDTLIIVFLIFNAGGLVYVLKNHVNYVATALDKIHCRLAEIEQRVSKIEGRLSDNHL